MMDIPIGAMQSMSIWWSDLKMYLIQKEINILLEPLRKRK